MQLIKDKQVTQDNWAYIVDETPLKADYIIVSLVRWQQEREQLSKVKHLGLRLESDVELDEIASDLSHFQLIELYIPVFTDGRAFTHARLLRSRYGYTGDIRASGDFMRDQVFYLNRVGVSSFELNDQDNAQQVIQSMSDFSVDSQESVA
ncbi:conserved hypothetical protein [Bathymodiolus platifrons methanotrophic gill symbiont]|uniref:DUF934 domain-containing protein n=1 Tax=Bathymodiolus platifrons methanotrophic gill symbiont TaxID=113268 RepID=UPI000B41F52B|nr:DUF934 domain-containing protein [Bathymodiolus platifrons methanotrophic gill symbiont]MCK5869640.1 DUF934 domain-containing protein [Methyloprofundus sp.]TXK97846.1 DUF934 domain-containing protein [Methylococcaceae bacterium CS4]TXL00362.1 DUF934 domain-containing protein [Methylococcaceae bacterium CS5]TXL02103.1 DUF934 domain-containing protein [Methylococcaceae bacterium HT1]TXL07489.1 DUF934 domain-containing protein [Methylococcaceae bacterium CS3]TXL08092.1 DUF934 domain-containin